MKKVVQVRKQNISIIFLRDQITAQTEYNRFIAVIVEHNLPGFWNDADSDKIWMGEVSSEKSTQYSILGLGDIVGKSLKHPKAIPDRCIPMYN